MSTLASSFPDAIRDRISSPEPPHVSTPEDFADLWTGYCIRSSPRPACCFPNRAMQKSRGHERKIEGAELLEPAQQKKERELRRVDHDVPLSFQVPSAASGCS